MEKTLVEEVIESLVLDFDKWGRSTYIYTLYNPYKKIFWHWIFSIHTELWIWNDISDFDIYYPTFLERICLWIALRRFNAKKNG